MAKKTTTKKHRARVIGPRELRLQEDRATLARQDRLAREIHTLTSRVARAVDRADRSLRVLAARIVERERDAIGIDAERIGSALREQATAGVAE